MIKLNKIKRNCVAAVIITMCLMTAGCARNSTSTTTASGGETTITSGITKEDTDVTHADDAENYRVSITGDFTVTSDTSDGVTQSGSVYTITKAGEYTVAGLLSEGQLIVDAGDEDEVTIVLNGTSITCSSGSPIYVKNASEVKIKSEENSFNEVIDNRTEATEDSSDDAGNAAIYATCDLKLVGKGALVVTGNYNNGIHANSDSGVLETGEDRKGTIVINGGSITISSGDDGMHADKQLDANDGYINIVTSYEGLEAITINLNGGKIYVYATDDGINACTGDGKTSPVVNVTAGYIDITTASGDTDGIDSNGNYVQSGGFVLVKGGSSSGNVSGSIDVDGTVTITGGTCVALGGVCETPINSANAYVLSSVSFSSGSYSLKDASGNEVISFTFDGSFSNGWICSDTLTTGTSYTLYRGSDSIADWTQEAGTMGASGTGGFGGGKMGGQNGSFGGGRR